MIQKRTRTAGTYPINPLIHHRMQISDFRTFPANLNHCIHISAKTGKIIRLCSNLRYKGHAEAFSDVLSPLSGHAKKFFTSFIHSHQIGHHPFHSLHHTAVMMNILPPKNFTVGV